MSPVDPRDAPPAVCPDGDTVLFPVAEFVDEVNLRVAGPDEAHVERLVEVVDELPPILVERSTGRVLDGVHRLLAAQRAGLEHVPARLVSVEQCGDALITAVKANAQHGLPLSTADRKASAMRILTRYPELSDRAVAEIVHLHPTTVARVRRLTRSTAVPQQLNASPAPPADLPPCPSGAVERRQGRDGRTRPRSAAPGRAKARELLEEDTGITLRELAKASGISLGTAHAVRSEYLRELGGCETPPPRSRRLRQGAASAARSDPRRTVLVSLGQDPSVARTDAGRSVLKRLWAMALDDAAREQFLEGVPAHRAEEVTDVIRDCVHAWTLVLQDLENRER